jgi:hypothetical protein
MAAPDHASNMFSRLRYDLARPLPDGVPRWHGAPTGAPLLAMGRSGALRRGINIRASSMRVLFILVRKRIRVYNLENPKNLIETPM